MKELLESIFLTFVAFVITIVVGFLLSIGFVFGLETMSGSEPLQNAVEAVMESYENVERIDSVRVDSIIIDSVSIDRVKDLINESGN